MELVAPIARRIHAKLPPSFDLDELIAVGNFALVRAATQFRPLLHKGTPFSAYARSAIDGAISDTFRRNKFAETTRPGLGDVLETAPGWRAPPMNAHIDLARRFASLLALCSLCLSPLQVAVFQEYYSTDLPELATVGLILGITTGQAERAHASGIRILRDRLNAA